MFTQLSRKKILLKSEEITRQNGRLFEGRLVITKLSLYSEVETLKQPWPKCNVVVRLH